MENVNKITKGFPTKAVKAIAMMALVMTFAACGNKGGGGGVNAPNGLGTNDCSGCSSITNPLAIGTVAAENMANGWSRYLYTIPAGSVRFSLNLFVNGNQFVPGSSSSYNLYSGPAALQGQMIVSSEWFFNTGMATCRIPVGTYNVQTTSVATMSTAGMIPRMELYATSGSNSVRMLVDQGMLLNFNSGSMGTTGAYRLLSGIGVLQVNGYTCPSNFGMYFQ